MPTAAEVIFSLHGMCFRFLSDRMDTDAEGLSVLARKAKNAGYISGNMYNELVQLEQAMKWTQHASTPKAKTFLRDLQAMVNDGGNSKPADGTILPDDAKTEASDELDSSPISTPLCEVLVPDELDCWYNDRLVSEPLTLPPPPAPPPLVSGLRSIDLETFRENLYGQSTPISNANPIVADPNDFVFTLKDNDFFQ